MALFDIANLADVPDWNRLIVADWELARKLQAENWEGPSGNNAYYLSFTEGEIHEVDINGNNLMQTFSVTNCDGNANSFYYDIAGNNLYVHTANDDSPANETANYTVVGYFNLGLASRGVSLRRCREALIDGRFDRWSNNAQPECWTGLTGSEGNISRESTEVYNSDSAFSAKLHTGTGTAPRANINQIVQIRPSAPVALSVYYKGSGNFYARVRSAEDGGWWLDENGNWTNSQVFIPVTDASNNWALYSLNFDAHNNCGNYDLWFGVNQNNTTIYLDNANLRWYGNPTFFLPYIGPDSIPTIRHAVGNFHEPEEQLSFGTVSLINDGYFSNAFMDSTWLWHNRKFRLMIGTANNNYEDLAPLFTGLSRQPILSGANFAVEVKDARAEFKSIPLTTFDSANYADCKEDYENRPIPIALGYFSNIAPPCSNTADYTYKVTETSFGNANYAQRTLGSVYKAGALQTENTHYTKDLANGTFTMLSNPGDNEITCSGTGLNFTWPDDGNAFFTPAGWLPFVAVDLNGISKEDIHWASLLVLHATRNTQGLGHWQAERVGCYELLRNIKATGMVYVYSRPNGEMCFRTLTSDVPSNTPRFYTEDFLTQPEVNQDSDQCYSDIIIRYRHFLSPPWETICTPSANRTIWQYGISRALPIDTYIYNVVQAANLGDVYRDILDEPITTLRATLPARAMALNPTDKIYVSYSHKDADGNNIDLFSEQVFIVLEVEKNIGDATATILALKSFSDLYWTM